MGGINFNYSKPILINLSLIAGKVILELKITAINTKRKLTKQQKNLK